jgi:TolB protein
VNKRRILRFLALLPSVWIASSCIPCLHAQTNSTPLGIFEDHADVGTVLTAGSVQYDPSEHTYTVSGSGENMWSTADAFQFVWKKVSGDVSLSADIRLLGTGGNAHRKAILILRQSLDPDSAYVDVARHGNGLTSLQYRDAQGAATHEIESNLSAPQRLRIEKRGDYAYMWLSPDGGPFQPSGASIKIHLNGQFYVGIGVCAHDKDAVEKAVFSNVDLQTPAPVASAETVLYSTLETVPIASTDRRVIYTAASHFEAPNWTRDGAFFIFNGGGHILRMPVAGGTPETIDTGLASRCNNDHGLSPDGKWLAISDQSQGDHNSLVYIEPLTGGTPRRITETGPSYWHGWSPDGKTIAFTGQRNGEFDIYTVPVEGGKETRLTTAKGIDDGPEYSPDGEYIYFNSERTGTMQIWRMHPDGSQQEQITSDDFNNWFPHISPDGKWMAFLTYEKSVSGHPPNKDVMVRVMSLSDKKIKILATLFGGQGTINVPSWSPDSLKVAFVSYELLPAQEIGAK